MKEKYVCKLEHGTYIAPWGGDPGRTLVLKNARRFKTKSSARRAIKKAQKFRSFKNACIITVKE